MKKEIKFKSWDDSKKIMIYFNNLQTQNTGGFWGGTREVYQISSTASIGECEDIGYFHNDFAEKVDLELMQFTRLKDKNGKEIYEGDILRNPENKKGVVEFFDGSFCLKSNGYYVLNSGFLKNKEVVGNIYENPELLILK